MKRALAIAALVVATWLGVVGLKLADAITRYAISATALAAASTRLAAAQEDATELTRRYYHALQDADRGRE